jgi:hypothetical protein
MYYTRRHARALFHYFIHYFIHSLFHSFIVSKRNVSSVVRVVGARRRVSRHTPTRRASMVALRSLVDARVERVVVASRRRPRRARVAASRERADDATTTIDVDNVAAPRFIAAALALALATTPAPVGAIPQTSECATNSCDGCVRDDARRRRGDARDAKKSPGWIFGFSRLTARRRARDSFERSRRYDYSGKDFTGTGEYFTKGSLKRANFNGANLTGISLFGADLTGATFVDANLSNANLGQANLTGADFTGALLSGAIVSSAQLDDVKIDNSDWSDVIVRKDVLTGLCKVANGENPTTGNPTAFSLLCP